MRPNLLNPLFAPLTSLAGIGPRLDDLYAKLLDRDEARVRDLLFHLPSGVIDRSQQSTLASAERGPLVTVKVIIDRHQAPPPRRGRAPYRIYAHDETQDLILTYFNARPDHLQKLLPNGAVRYVSGTIELWDGMLQMVHPERIVDEAAFARLPLIDPIYPLTEGLAIGPVRRAVAAALEKLKPLPEWQDQAWLIQQNWPSFHDALAHLHRPESAAAISADTPAWSRLAFDELLAGQIALLLVRARLRIPRGRASAGDGGLRRKIIAALPYTLTGSQQQALAEIAADLAKPERMLRLLQGDVGSGKTVVALLAAAATIETGSQAAMMAPTEILARQHLKTIQPLADAAGIRIALLTGRDRGRERDDILHRLESGEIDLLIGTHALFSDDVAFRDLALAIIDEQHRFGVHQRLALARKGDAVDMLVLTATPIPRTLVLTYFGDMEVSSLREKPAGRLPIDTRAIEIGRIDEVTAGIGRALSEGQQVYWVCPLIEESETVDLANATERFTSLKARFGEKVDLVHGQMKGAEKDAAMARFAAGDTLLLVATTVIEVGVDVPRASIMVIEQAERFGLAQLHQLRGRIGRGAARSSCLLIYKGPLGEAAERRITIMRETDDGFRIAEEDLKLRGEGDVLGTRQSGMPGFTLARMEHHANLVEPARADAKLVLSRDPTLSSPRGEAIRMLLYLFEKDEAVRLIRAG